MFSAFLLLKSFRLTTKTHAPIQGFVIFKMSKGQKHHFTIETVL